MPCRYGSTPENRVRVELVEADLEIGFNLVDMAGANPGLSSQLLTEAERVYGEILTRVKRLLPADDASLQPLVLELRRALDEAAPRHSAAG